MMNILSSLRRMCAALLFGSAALCGALGDANALYPERPITFICASGAGGIVDVTARIIAEDMSKTLGQPVIVQNEPSAGTTLAIKMAARAAPDGYTLLFIGAGLTVVQELYPDARIDAVKDLLPVTLIGDTPLVLYVSDSVPGNDFPSFISYLRSHPDETTYGSNGRGTGSYLAMEYFKKLADVRVRYIPYKTTPQVITDLIAGRLSMTMTASGGDIAKYPNIRAVGITALARAKAYPSIPTFSEFGLPGFESGSPTVLLAPNGTPPEIIGALHSAVDKALTDPKTRERLDKVGILQPKETGPNYAKVFIRQEVAKWAEILRDTK